MNNFYPQQTKVITKQATSLFSFALKALGIFLLFMGGSVGSVNAKTWYVINNVKSGELDGWQNPSNWTEDPSAQVYSNPGLNIPANGDNVVVRAGKEIIIPAAFLINAGTVTVDGALYIAGALDEHKLTALRGSGRVYINGAKLPDGDVSNFVSPGSGAGTVVLQGAGPINLSDELEVYNLEIDMDGSEGAVLLQNDLTVNGNLNVKRGKLMFDGASSQTLLVNRNVSVQADGYMGVTTASAFHNMIVEGDFRNYGTVKFSNAQQYAAADNGAIRLTFKGATNNDFVINGSTQLYRLFINKGENDFYTLSVTSNNVDHFKLMGPYAGSTGPESSESGLEGWKRLPLVISKGTLKLGSNIKIDRLGYDRDGAGVNEFHIPSGAALWVNGAEVQTASESDFVNGAYANSGLSLEGRLRMSAGTFTIPGKSEGIGYRGLESKPSELIVEGGTIFTTQLRSIGGRHLNYRQSDGTIDFYARTGAPWESPVFNLPNSTQVFEMSGGTMIFRVANDRGGDSHGIQILSGVGNYNVSGGSLEIYTPIDNDFQILSSAPFYDIKVLAGTGTKPVVFREHWSYPNELHILNSLEIGIGTVVNAGQFELGLGKDLYVEGTLSFSSGIINLVGDANATLTNKSGSNFGVPNLNVLKGNSASVVTLAGTNSFSFGQIELTRGSLDLADQNITVSDAVNLHNGSLLATGTGSTGSATLSDGVILNSSRGKENSFGYLKLASGATVGATVNLSSHAKAKKVDFLGNGIFNIGTYNLEIEESNYNGTDWSTSKMFKTTGKGSDGGLTLNFTIQDAGDIALFPVGTTAYRPAKVEVLGANSPSASGAFTIVPVDGAHPATDVGKNNEVLGYYWRSKVSGFGDLKTGIVQLEFTCTGTEPLKNLKGAYLNGTKWLVGSYGYKNKDVVLIFNNTDAYGPYGLLMDADYTAGTDNGSGQIPISGVRVFTSTGSHDWGASDWKDDKGATNVGPPTASDIAIIRAEDVVTISASNAVASQVEVKGTLYVESATRSHTFDLIKGNGRLVYEYDASESDQSRIQNIINADYSEFINSPEAIIEYAGTGGYGLAEVSKIPYYPNLHISGGTTNVKTHRNDGSLRVRGNLVIKDAPLSVEGNYGQIIEIGKNLIIENSSFSLAAAGNTNTFIAGDIHFTGTGSLLGRNSNEVHLQGNIELGNGTINTPSEKWFLEGDMPSIISGNNAGAPNRAVFNRLIIDKKEVHHNNAYLNQN